MAAEEVRTYRWSCGRNHHIKVHLSLCYLNMVVESQSLELLHDLSYISRVTASCYIICLLQHSQTFSVWCAQCNGWSPVTAWGVYAIHFWNVIREQHQKKLHARYSATVGRITQFWDRVSYIVQTNKNGSTGEETDCLSWKVWRHSVTRFQVLLGDTTSYDSVDFLISLGKCSDSAEKYASTDLQHFASHHSDSQLSPRLPVLKLCIAEVTKQSLLKVIYV